MRRFFFTTFLSVACFAFDGDPWVIEPLRPDVKALYSYSFFSKVHGYGSHYSNNQLLLSMNIAFANHFQLGLEFDQDASTFKSFYFRAAAIELKKQFSDDVAEGDHFSMATGIRGVAQTALGRLDPATLYPGGYHFEAFVSLGKEWAFQQDHFLRFWLLGGLGVATSSSPWVELEADVFYRYRQHELKVFAVGDLGYGAATYVDLNHFQGWGPTRYRYLDVGLSYGYQVGSNLFIKTGFTKRALAKVMARNYNCFTLALETIF
jgi:hypothetical protein